MKKKKKKSRKDYGQSKKTFSDLKKMHQMSLGRYGGDVSRTMALILHKVKK